MADGKYKESRVFLHDIASPMAVLRLVLKRLLAIQQGDVPQEERAKAVELVERALSSLQKMEQLHANFKADISQKEIALKEAEAAVQAAATAVGQGQKAS